MVCFDFDCIFADLQQYKRENGNLSISSCHPLFSSIMDELLSLGMEDLLRKRWDDQFADLRAFKERYEDCLVPPTHPTLGNWARIQCGHYRLYSQRHPSPLTKERFHLLKGIGFDELASCKEVEAHEINGIREAARGNESPGDRPRTKKGDKPARVSFESLPSPTAARRGEIPPVCHPREQGLATKESLEVEDRPKNNTSRESALKSSSPPHSQRLRRPKGKTRELARRRRPSSVPPRLPEETGNVRESPTKKTAKTCDLLDCPGSVCDIGESQRTKAIESFEARLKRKLSSESSKGPAVPPKKPLTRPHSVHVPGEGNRSRQHTKLMRKIQSFEERLAEKMSRAESDGDSSVLPERPSVGAEKNKKSATESFEDRLEKVNLKNPRGPPVSSVRVNGGAYEGLSLSQKIDLKLKQKRTKRTPGGERPSAVGKYERRMLRRSVEKGFGRRKSSKILMEGVIEEVIEEVIGKGGGGDAAAAERAAKTLLKRDSLVRSCSSTNLCTGSVSLKGSLALDQVFSEDDIGVDYTSWSELEGALETAARQSLWRP